MKPETHFDQMVQQAGEVLAEIRGVILSFKTSRTTDPESETNNGNEHGLINCRSQLYKVLSEVTRIAGRLQEFVEETSTRRRTSDSAINPRVISTVKYREASLNGLLKAIRDTRKSLQVACEEKERKHLLGWSSFDRPNRTQRDADELMSGATERLMNSKRILLETIQSSSGTLTCLATSSQSVQGNDRELHSQTSMISSARSLLRKYGRRASTDKVLVWLSFIFFGVCAFFVVYRRLF